MEARPRTCAPFSIDIDVQLRVDRRRLVVDDRRVLEDRREPIELELRRDEIERRGHRASDRARPSRSTACPARRRSRPRDRATYVPGARRIRDDRAGDARQRQLRPQRELAAVDRDRRRRARALRDLDRRDASPSAPRSSSRVTPRACATSQLGRPRRIAIGDQRGRAGHLRRRRAGVPCVTVIFGRARAHDRRCPIAGACRAQRAR